MKKIIFIGAGVPFEAAEKLRSFGLDVRILRTSPRLPSYVASHVDMLLLNIDGTLVCGRDVLYENRDILSDIGDITVGEDARGDYPSDVKYNAFVFNGRLYAKRSALSEAAETVCYNKGTEIIDVRQGYAKCSCLVTDKMVVTADPSIAAALMENGESVLKIRAGHIRLDGVDHGFIGGASLFDGERVFFFGKIRSHPDGDAIIEYCERFGYEVFELCDTELTDVGGGVTFTV